MDSANFNGIFEVNCQNPISFLELFIPFVIGVRVGEREGIFCAMASGKGDLAGSPVYEWIVMDEPVVTEEDLL